MSGAALCKAIKTVVDTQLEASNLTDLAIGTVVSATPLRVKIEGNNLEIEAKNLILTTNVADEKVDCYTVCPEHGKEYGFIMNALATGDKLVLIKTSKGQRYIVIGKVV